MAKQGYMYANLVPSVRGVRLMTVTSAKVLTAPRVRGKGPALLNFKGPTQNHCNLTVSSSLPPIDPLSYRRNPTRNPHTSSQ
jgi:hypothetical protein